MFGTKYKNQIKELTLEVENLTSQIKNLKEENTLLNQAVYFLCEETSQLKKKLEDSEKEPVSKKKVTVRRKTK